MKYNLNIWRSPDDGIFRFHVENEMGQAIHHTSTACENAIKQGMEHLQQSLLADFSDDPEMFNRPKE